MYSFGVEGGLKSLVQIGTESIMEAHVMVARHHVNSGIFPRGKQRVEPENEKVQFQVEVKSDCRHLWT